MHHFAALIGYGAGAVNPYLALETMNDLCDPRRSRPGPSTTRRRRRTTSRRCTRACSRSCPRWASRTLQSYRGAQIFEAVGLNQEFVDQYFTWTPSRIGGIGIEEIEAETRARHTLRLPGAQHRRQPRPAVPAATTSGVATASTTCTTRTRSRCCSTPRAATASRRFQQFTEPDRRREPPALHDPRPARVQARQPDPDRRGRAGRRRSSGASPPAPRPSARSAARRTRRWRSP